MRIFIGNEMELKLRVFVLLGDLNFEVYYD